MKLRAETRRRDRERQAALVLLGRLAWEQKVDLAGLPELTRSLSRIEGEAGALAAALGELEKERGRLESNRADELRRRQSERDAVERQKKPVDAALRVAQSRTSDIEEATRRLDKRSGAISARLTALEHAIQATGASGDPKQVAERETALRSQEQLVVEQKQIAEERGRRQAELSSATAEVSRLTGESALYASEIEKIERLQRAAVAEIDAALNEVRSRIDARTRETTALGTARDAVFGQVGRALYEGGGPEPGLAEAVSAVQGIDRARAAAVASVQASLAETAAMPRGTMVKFTGVVLGVVCLIAVGIAVTSALRGPAGHGRVVSVARAPDEPDARVEQTRPMPSFSAEVTVTAGERRRSVKLYATERAFRSEGEEDGRPFIIIVRLNRNLVWMLSPEHKTYDETVIGFGENTASLSPPPIGRGCRAAGEEKVGAFLSVKTECTVTIDGKTITEYQWAARDLGGLVIKHTDGTETYEIRSVRLGPQSPALFDIPAGYRKAGA